MATLPKSGRSRDLSVAAILILASGSSVFGQSPKPKIEISAFANPSEFPKAAIGESLTEILLTELKDSGRFEILDGQEVGALETQARYGKGQRGGVPAPHADAMMRADYLLRGKVTTFDYRETLLTDTYAARNRARADAVYEQVANVRIDFRLTDVNTRQVVLSQAGLGTARTRSAVSYRSQYLQFCSGEGAFVSELKESVLGRATEQAIKNLAQKLSDLSAVVRSHGDAATQDAISVSNANRGAILADLGDGSFVISLGQDAGLRVGDLLNVSAETATRDRKGAIVYRRDVLLGTLRVLDISMPDRAMAGQFTPIGATAGARRPQEQDVVSLARVTTPSGGETSQRREETGDGAVALVRQGDRFFEDGNVSQAEEAYAKAAHLAGSASVLEKLARAQLSNRSFLEGETTIERMLAGKHPFGLPMAHFHGLSNCSGMLTLQHGQLAFLPDKGDHAVTLTTASITGIELSGVSNWKHHRIPSLIVRWRSQNGDEERHTFVSLLFSTVSPTGRRSWESDRHEDVAKVHRVLERLVRKFVLTTGSGSH